MIRIGAPARAPVPGLDALVLQLRRIPTPRLSERRARVWPEGLLIVHSVPYLAFENAVDDGRTLRRLERHTRPMGATRGPAVASVPAGVRPSYLLALAAAQSRMTLHVDLDPQDRSAAIELGLSVVARQPDELEPGGLAWVAGHELEAWVAAARAAGEGVLLANLKTASKLASLLRD